MTEEKMIYLNTSNEYQADLMLFDISEKEIKKQMENLFGDPFEYTVKKAKSGYILTINAEDNLMKLDVFEALLKNIQDYFKSFIYDTHVSSLEETLYQLLLKSKRTLAVAESCTGGLVSKRITDIPGVSTVYVGGICTYQTEMKTKLLGVNSDTIRQYGVVSKNTADEMSKGIRRVMGSDYGAGITGYTGPEGDQFAEAGTGYVSVVGLNGTPTSRCLSVGINRDTGRKMASDYTLFLLIKEIKKGQN